MKRSFKSKSKSKKKDQIKVKKFQNSERKELKIKIPQIKPINPNQLNKNIPTEPKENNKEKVIKNEKEEKIEELFLGADNPPKYTFNLHKHLKENLKFKDKQCKNGLTK